MKGWRIAAFGMILCGCGGGSSHSGGSATVVRSIIATGLDQPMFYAPDPANSHRAYVLERPGRVRLLIDDALQSAPVLDISSVVVTPGECGLAGIAFAPDFATSRSFYLYYNTQTGNQLETRISRFTMSGDGQSATMTGPIFKVDQPFDNHKGGTIRFGPDGFLYLALGDGGSGNDPGNRAQDPTVLLGKVLRIDPSGDDLPADPDNDYRIPASNPFVGTSGVRGEIWNFGMRNPFRWSFDAPTGAMIIADVGQDAFEEIDVEPAASGGRNYGWRQHEGPQDTGLGGAVGPGTQTDPILTYDHGVGRSIIGGYVYRNDALPDGYLFADYVTNRLWSLPIGITAGGAAPTSLAAARPIAIAGGWDGVVSIEPDANGEPVVTELNAGRVSRLVAAP